MNPTIRYGEGGNEIYTVPVWARGAGGSTALAGGQPKKLNEGVLREESRGYSRLELDVRWA